MRNPSPILLCTVVALLAPPALAAPGSCPLPIPRDVLPLREAAQQDEMLAQALLAVGEACRAGEDTPACKTEVDRCTRMLGFLQQRTGQHRDEAFLADAREPWIGERFPEASSLPSPVHHGPTACVASASALRQVAARRQRAAEGHRAVAELHERWLPWATRVTERCRDEQEALEVASRQARDQAERARFEAEARARAEQTRRAAAEQDTEALKRAYEERQRQAALVQQQARQDAERRAREEEARRQAAYARIQAQEAERIRAEAERRAREAELQAAAEREREARRRAEQERARSELRGQAIASSEEERDRREAAERDAESLRRAYAERVRAAQERAEAERTEARLRTEEAERARTRAAEALRRQESQRLAAAEQKLAGAAGGAATDAPELPTRPGGAFYVAAAGRALAPVADLDRPFTAVGLELGFRQAFWLPASPGGAPSGLELHADADFNLDRPGLDGPRFGAAHVGVRAWLGLVSLGAVGRYHRQVGLPAALELPTSSLAGGLSVGIALRDDEAGRISLEGRWLPFFEGVERMASAHLRVETGPVRLGLEVLGSPPMGNEEGMTLQAGATLGFRLPW